MKQYPRSAAFILLILFCSFSLEALDVGLLLDQNAEVSDRNEYEYTGALVPRLSGLLGDNGEFLFSAILSYGTDSGIFVPELLRTEITMRFGIGEYTIGRMPYRDPLGIIAEGFFDGARVSFNTTAGTLSAGCWFTGGLYKKRAFITMTDDEAQSYNTEMDYNDFFNTYFAPRRVFSSLSWEHPSLGGPLDIKLAILGQFDLSGAGLYTQYLSAKVALPFRYFIFDAGGCYEMIEHSSEFRMALAAEMGLTWILPTSLENHISLRGRYSSGVIEGDLISIDAFLPLSTIPQGNVLETKLSGLSVVSLSYLSRIHHVLSTSLSATYFMRSGLESYTGYPTDAGSGDYFLGAEFFGRFLWSLSTGLQINVGGGVFLPMLGNAAPKADLLWRVNLNVVFSLF